MSKQTGLSGGAGRQGIARVRSHSVQLKTRVGRGLSRELARPTFAERLIARLNRPVSAVDAFQKRQENRKQTRHATASGGVVVAGVDVVRLNTRRISRATDIFSGFDHVVAEFWHR